MSSVSVLDVDLSHHDVQTLNGPDAVAAFFARLGYNTNARTSQTPGNLGITADGTVRPIKKIELIADQEALFQVYLFELTSVTVAHTRALARAFRAVFFLAFSRSYCSCRKPCECYKFWKFSFSPVGLGLL